MQANPLAEPSKRRNPSDRCLETVAGQVHNQRMSRYGAMYGPDVTFTGVPRCDLSDPASYADASAVIVGAPYDSGTSYRSGARMGPMALRICDYSEHTGSRPHLSLRVDPLAWTSGWSTPGTSRWRPPRRCGRCRTCRT